MSVEIPVDAKNNPKVAFQCMVEGIFKTMNVCFPACIYGPYDKETRTVTVLPLVKYKDFDGKETEFKKRQPFPMFVRRIRCGGFAIETPLHVGDTGWVIASDRVTSDLREKGRKTTDVLADDVSVDTINEEYQSEPKVQSTHTFLSGFFIPDSWSDVDYQTRFKDAEDLEVDANKDLYIGTSLDTKETYEAGEEYDKRSSCSIVMKNSKEYESGPMLVISQSSPKGDGKFASIQLGDALLKVISTGAEATDGETRTDVTVAGDNVSVFTTIDGKTRYLNIDGDGITLSAGETSISITEEGINIFGNVTINGSMSADEIIMGNKKISTVGEGHGNLVAQ